MFDMMDNFEYSNDLENIMKVFYHFLTIEDDITQLRVNIVKYILDQFSNGRIL